MVVNIKDRKRGEEVSLEFEDIRPCYLESDP
jgi:hypothetical protein